MSRDQLTENALRLEDKAADGSKDLWIMECTMDGDVWLMIVEALSPVGAVVVAETLDLMPTDTAFTMGRIHGPHSRGCWPEKYWYRWLTEDDVAEMEADAS